jgi:hypothetical protein
MRTLAGIIFDLIRFSLDFHFRFSEIKFVIYDILGRQVKTLVNEYKQAGTYQVNFNAEGLSSGIYFYKMTAGDFSETKKLVLVK